MDRSEKRILAVVAALVVVVLAVAAGVTLNARTQADFEAPPFEVAAEAGVPDISDAAARYGELELPVSEGKCVIAMDATPLFKDGALYVYFTSNEDNSVYVRVVLSDENGAVIGESGVLRPGEYVPAVSVAEALAGGDTVTAKIVTYEPGTYYSMGSADATLGVRD